VAHDDELTTVPGETFRFLVSEDPIDPHVAVRLLDRGGIVASALRPDQTLGQLGVMGLRPLEATDGPDPCWIIARREA
jgi:hypothetical protein